MAATLAFVILLSITTTTAANFTVKLIPRDSLHPNNLTEPERIERLVQQSKDYIRRYDRAQPDMLRPLMTETRMFYIIQASIGSGGTVLSKLHFDLASDLTWVQCNPCNPCFRQPGERFDPLRSTTFRALPNDHRLCNILPQDPNRAGSPFCTYRIDYFDGTSSSGYLGQERFIFLSDTPSELFNVYQGIAFGCTMSSNFPDQDTGDFDGIIGMGSKPISIVSQMGDVINHRFSYCLVKPESGIGSFLTFGLPPPRQYQSMPFYTYEDSGNYYLALEDIIIGGRPLNLPPGTFDREGPNEGGVVIDTGASVTHLVHDAYQAVSHYLISYFEEGLHLTRVEQWAGLDLCYKTPPSPETALPGMVFNFEAAYYEMTWENVFVLNQRTGIFCLGMLESDSVSLFGARMMANHRFAFNLQDKAISFVEEFCHF